MGTELDRKQETAQVEDRSHRGPVMCPRTDIRESEDHFSIEVDLPGVAPKDVDLQVEGDDLRVTATRGDAGGTEGQDRMYLVRERRNGTYARVFHLGALVDRESIEGKLSDGVLRIRVSKHKNAMPRRIAIN